MSAQINTIISVRSFELIRDRIAEVLSTELPNQATLQSNNDLNAKVYIEKTTPTVSALTPEVNVGLTKTDYTLKTAITKNGTHSFDIDVYTKSKSEIDTRGDELAMKKLQKLIGVIQGILSHPKYRTLGFSPPFIEGTMVVGFQIANPDNTRDTATTMMGRITYTVRATDINPSSLPTMIAGYTSQVLMGLTDLGYLYTSGGAVPPVPPILCAPIDVTFNGNDLLPTPTGYTRNFIVLNTLDEETGTVESDSPGETIIRVPAASVCLPSTSTFNGTNLVPTPSGENKNITLTNSASTQVGSITTDNANNLGLTVSNSDVELNGVKVGEVLAEGTINIPVVQDSLPVGSWNGTEFVIPSCPPPAPVKSGVIFKTVPPITDVSYENYDEGWRFVNGWWNDVIPTDPLYIAELDFTTSNYFYKLKNAIPVNGVSNTMRFVDVDGVQNFDPTDNKDQILIDKYTGLGMSRVHIPIGNNWSQMLNYANSYSVVVDGVTYNEWYLMSLHEITEIIGGFEGQSVTVVDPITTNTIISLVDLTNRLVLSSTTRLNSTTNCWEYQPVNVNIIGVTKIATTRIGYMVTKQVRNLIGI